MRWLSAPLSVIAIRVTCVEATSGAALVGLVLWPDLGALIVVGLLVPVTLVMHRVWMVEPSRARKQKRDACLTTRVSSGPRC